MNILIVEDEINLAMALKEIMDKQRYQTTIAFDGED